MLSCNHQILSLNISSSCHHILSHFHVYYDRIIIFMYHHHRLSFINILLCCPKGACWQLQIGFWMYDDDDDNDDDLDNLDDDDGDNLDNLDV